MDVGESFDYKGWAHRASDGGAVELDGSFVVTGKRNEGESGELVEFADGRVAAGELADVGGNHSYFANAEHLDAGAGAADLPPAASSAEAEQ